jgi:four helix bundle protein
VIESSLRRRYGGLARQLERSLSSIPANLAEGAGHDSRAQFGRYISIAIASAREAEYHLLLARDLGALDSKVYAGFEARLGEVVAMLIGLRRRVATQSRTPPTTSRSARRVRAPTVSA